jgi:hypothetical protein
MYPNRWFNRGWAIAEIEYEYGSEAPPDICRAINQLAQEFARADAGLDCALPERVTSVSREGVSWTLIDPQDFLDHGRTGIYFVDLVLKAYSGSASRTEIFSPEMRPPRRISVEVVDV